MYAMDFGTKWLNSDVFVHAGPHSLAKEKAGITGFGIGLMGDTEWTHYPPRKLMWRLIRGPKKEDGRLVQGPPPLPC